MSLSHNKQLTCQSLNSMPMYMDASAKIRWKKSVAGQEHTRCVGA